MVVPLRRRIVVGTAIGGVVLLLCSMLWTQVCDSNGEHTVSISLKTALGVYFDRHGNYPETLQEVRPTLEELTRAECRISEIEDGKYDVFVRTPSNSFALVVAYSADPNGRLERFYVESVR